MSKRGQGAKNGTRRFEPRRDKAVSPRSEAAPEERYTTLEGFLAGLYGLDPAGVDEPGPRALVERVQRLTRGEVAAREILHVAPGATGEILADLLGKDELELAFTATQEGDPAALTDALLASLSRLEQRAGAPS